MKIESKSSNDGSLLLFISVFVMGLILAVAGGSANLFSNRESDDNVLGASLGDSDNLHSLEQCSDIQNDPYFATLDLKSYGDYRRLDFSVTPFGGFTNGSCVYLIANDTLKPILVTQEDTDIVLEELAADLIFSPSYESDTTGLIID